VVINNLATRKTKNGLPITAISLIRMPLKEVDAEADKLQCDYVVKHISPDDVAAGNPGAPFVEPSGDRDMVSIS
jgi:hypothetical protein